MSDPTQAPDFETKDGVGFGRSTEVQDEQAPREPAGITRSHEGAQPINREDQR